MRTVEVEFLCSWLSTRSKSTRRYVPVEVPLFCGRIGLDAGHSQAPKDNVSAFAALSKYEKWRNFHSLVGRAVQGGEARLQQLVSTPGSVVEIKARLLVVAEVGEHAGVHVDEIGPVRVVHAEIQDHETWGISTADRAEAALIAGTGNELAQNIVRGVSLRAAFVNRIDKQVSGRQCGEWKYLGQCSKADFRTKRRQPCAVSGPVRRMPFSESTTRSGLLNALRANTVQVGTCDQSETSYSSRLLWCVVRHCGV